MKFFSFIEIIIVLVIISAALALMAPSVISIINDARYSKVQEDFYDIVNSVKLYYSPDADIYAPISGDDIIDKDDFSVPVNHGVSWGVDIIDAKRSKDIFQILYDDRQIQIPALIDPWGSTYEIVIDTEIKGYNTDTPLSSPFTPFLSYYSGSNVVYVIPFIGDYVTIGIRSAGPDKVFHRTYDGIPNSQNSPDDISKEIQIRLPE